MRTSIPLYHHLKSTLIRQIQDGKWGPGEAIPSEAELAHQFTVSRTTVRQAVGDLVTAGYLVRRQGKGTFVAEAQKAMAHSPLYGFAEELRQRGNQIEVRVDAVDVLDCPTDVADILGAILAIRVSRTAHLDGACIFRETAYLVPPMHLSSHHVRENPEQFDHIYGFLEQHGVQIGLAHQTIRAEKADAVDTVTLQVAPDEPVLVIRRVTKDITGMPVEYSEVRYRASCYEYEISLHRAER